MLELMIRTVLLPMERCLLYTLQEPITLGETYMLACSIDETLLGMSTEIA